MTNCFEVVPLTIESSTSIIDFPFNTLLSGFSFIFTPNSLSSWVGFINVLPTYLFLTSASVSGSPLAFAYPIAPGQPESGTGTTISALISSSCDNIFPDSTLNSYAFTLSIVASFLAKYICSNIQLFFIGLQLLLKLYDFNFPFFITTISPGSKSLINSPPSISISQFSDAKIYSPLSLFPSNKGLNPCGSLTAISSWSVNITNE